MSRDYLGKRASGENVRGNASGLSGTECKSAEQSKATEGKAGRAGWIMEPCWLSARRASLGGGGGGTVTWLLALLAKRKDSLQG